jgi:hypothetical protein
MKPTIVGSDLVYHGYAKINERNLSNLVLNLFK